jgi:ABC-type Fe3+-siderophore transport system permease subunit
MRLNKEQIKAAASMWSTLGNIGFLGLAVGAMLKESFSLTPVAFVLIGIGWTTCHLVSIAILSLWKED